MDRKRSAALVCAAVLAAALPGPARTRPAGGPAEVELESRPLVALTFDDGPREATTGPLLDGLALREVPATFFLVGSRIGGNEDLVRRMAAEGHQIGVHTFDHVALKGLSRRDFDLQVGKTRAVLADLLGEGEFWLRPPYGLIDQAAASWAGGPLILWSVDPEDWKDHDVDSSEEAALRVVDALLAKGYCFVTVEQLMEQRGAAPEAGARCRAFPPGKDRGGNF